MSWEKEDPVVLNSPDQSEHESQRRLKVRYTREVLLSLSELDACKKLPVGFDASILSEFEVASGSAFEHQKNLGGYGLLGHNRLDGSGGYSRGGQGRWDVRSTGSSDKDGELQSDREPILQDASRPYGNQTRRHWQNSEHDGLLGNGAFPKPTGYAPKARGVGQYPLNRGTEPYQPPRPFEAMPYSWKDSTDSYNDETFGSDGCSSEDRAEEERKRRVSFELMRKEQQKALQGKKKQISGNRKDDIDADIIGLLGNPGNGNEIGNGSKPDETSKTSSHNDAMKYSVHLQVPASRPLVPPGFASTLVEKTISSSTSFSPEGGSSLVENKPSLSCKESNEDRGSTSCMHINKEKNPPKVTSHRSHLSADAYEKPPVSSDRVVNPTESSSSKIDTPDASEVWADDIIIMDDSSCTKRPSEFTNSVGQDHSITILEKLFSSALSKNISSTSNSVQHQVKKADRENSTSQVFESSKFALWFSEEEEKNEEDFSSRELFSLISSNEKVGPQLPTFNEKVHEHIPLSLGFESITTPLNIPTSSATSSVDIKHPNSDVLTCEDLEQSILAEVKDKSLIPDDSIQGTWTRSNDNSKKKKVDVDDHASQHLLSLLQKGVSLKESTSSPAPDFVESSERFPVSHVSTSPNLHVPDAAAVRNPKTVHSSEQTLTLEALFGSSFMNALHSAKAPISAQGGLANDNGAMQQHEELPFPHEARSNKTIYKGEMLALNKTQKEQNIPGPWAGVYGNSSSETSKFGDIGTEGRIDIQLPEEDSLIIGDTLNPSNPNPFKPEEFFPEKDMEDLNHKFLTAILQDGERLMTRDGERLMTHISEGRLQKGPLETIDPNNLYHHLHSRSSSQFPHHMDQARPEFFPVDHLGRRNLQTKFNGIDFTHHDPQHPFLGNCFPHHGYNNDSAPRFDPNATVYHPMLQHVPVPENFPHLPMQGLSRGEPRSHHPINHMPGYTHETNDIHNFPLHHRQPNYGGGYGMGLPGSVGLGGGTHPEALKKLFEMERRANNPQQIHHPVGAHFPGIYGPEVDMNLRYR